MTSKPGVQSSNGSTSKPEASNGANGIAPIFADSATQERAVQQAVREAISRHKKLGESIAVWRDGRVVIIPPEEIPED